NTVFRVPFFPFLGYALHSGIAKENINMTTLSYSVTEPALRSPVEEWQPHGKQSESTTEWWYLTAVVHDTAGNPISWFGVPSTSLARRLVRRLQARRVTRGQSPL